MRAVIMAYVQHVLEIDLPQACFFLFVASSLPSFTKFPLLLPTLNASSYNYLVFQSAGTIKFADKDKVFRYRPSKNGLLRMQKCLIGCSLTSF